MKRLPVLDEDRRSVGQWFTDWAKLVAAKEKEITRLNGIYARVLEGAGVERIETTVSGHNVPVLGLYASLGFRPIDEHEVWALGLPEPEETAPDFVGNARIKALAAARASGLPAASLVGAE